MCEFYKVSNFPWISYRKVPKDLEIIMTSPIIKNFFKRFFLRVMHFHASNGFYVIYDFTHKL
jgi:hypothetical protein